MKSPYTGLEPRKFWRSGVAEAHPLTIGDLYRKKFPIRPSDNIATAGSCFAQHVANFLRANGFSVMDVEPSPPFLSDESARKFGYGIYSARYGNIYTVRQLLQLVQDAEERKADAEAIWTRDGRFFDALRPNIEPDGFETLEEALALRRDHLAKVMRLFVEMDVFIFTLGLTEGWIDKGSGRVFPTAPGTIAGDFDPKIHALRNFRYDEIYDDFVEFHDMIRERNPGLKFILTVSPVPLTATATDNHVLTATTYSKSVLRAVAGALADKYPDVDYFPSYEMIASPWSKGFFYESNMREVNSGGVAAVMRVFFDQHRPAVAAAAVPADPQESRRNKRRERKRKAGKPGKQEKPAAEAAKPAKPKKTDEDIVCEEILLEAFAP